MKVAVVGATGLVGTKMLQVLAERNFPVTELLPVASEKSVGKEVEFKGKKFKVVSMTDAIAAKPAVALFSAGGSTSLEWAPKFAEAGSAVVSNSSAFRMQGDVPLVIPEVNADHLALIEQQAWRKKSGGFIVTNPNCSAIGLVVALAPLHEKFGIESLFVTTMQAVSGAGYPGVASLDILGNVIPFIKNEEEKMEEETRKLLGKLNSHSVVDAAFGMTAHCNRVAVEDGHTESVSIKLKKKASAEEIVAALEGFKSKPYELGCPLAPEKPLVYDAAPDRPQPRFDLDRGKGMTVSVGRLRPCGLLDYKFTVLSHNTIRGAAGAALLNAELLKVQGYLS